MQPVFDRNFPLIEGWIFRDGVDNRGRMASLQFPEDDEGGKLLAGDGQAESGIEVAEVRQFADEFTAQARVGDELAVALAPGALHKPGDQGLLVMHGTSVSTDGRRDNRDGGFVMKEARTTADPHPTAARFLLLSILFCAAALTAHAQGDVPEWCRKLPRAEFAKLERVPTNDGWFEVYRVAPQTFAIYEPHQSEETIGYLILGSERALLFDTGMGIGDLKALIGKVTRLPVVVMNSHTHDDHVGSNWQFETVYGMDTSFTRESAKDSKADAQAEIAPGEVCGKLPPGFDRAAYATRPWKIARWMHDGDRIDLGGRAVEILATPGHTPDAICLFDRANGLLFTGDTYYPGTLWIYRPETDLAAYGKSVRLLAALQPEVKLVLGAHNVPGSRPAVLGELAAAFERVQTHQVQPKPAGPGKATYAVGDISFLMKAP
ncbi:MBL fold metallo-hydrolase [Acidobacteria bacterium AB60]|nr:MBL fold metallo-hydrolase [Acidobacteria bacterium AB60]